MRLLPKRPRTAASNRAVSNSATRRRRPPPPWSLALGLAVVVGWLCTAGPVSAAELELVVQPLFTPERSQRVYRHLTNYLSEVTPHEVTLVTPRQFRVYWRKLRDGEDYALAYDDAHLAHYRMDRLGYSALARETERMRFAIVANAELAGAERSALYGKRLATMPAPSLDYSVLMRLFPDPIRQPNLVSTAQSRRDAIEIIFNDEAVAAIVPGWLARRYPNLPKLHETGAFPGSTITAAPSVSEQVRNDIREALLSLSERKEYYSVLVELNSDGFEPASPDDYTGLHSLLNYMYGY